MTAREQVDVAFDEMVHYENRMIEHKRAKLQAQCDGKPQETIDVFDELIDGAEALYKLARERRSAAVKAMRSER